MTSYKTDSMEGKYIPASQRPDGTWRKARRVKEGYVPQEEVPLYESKGKLFAKTKSTLPPGMCPLVAEAARKEREKQEKARAKKEAAAMAAAAAATAAHCDKASGGNIKKAGNANNAQAGAVPKKAQTVGTSSKTKNKGASNINDLAQQVERDLHINEDAEANQDLNKQLKKFRKKLREIESLEEKLKNREIKNADKEQLEKIKKKKEIKAEIARLEALVGEMSADEF